jgi:hypothetical protein
MPTKCKALSSNSSSAKKKKKKKEEMEGRKKSRVLSSTRERVCCSSKIEGSCLALEFSYQEASVLQAGSQLVKRERRSQKK